MEHTMENNENQNRNTVPRHWYGMDYEMAHVDYRKPRIGYILDEDGNYPEGCY